MRLILETWQYLPYQYQRGYIWLLYMNYYLGNFSLGQFPTWWITHDAFRPQWITANLPACGNGWEWGVIKCRGLLCWSYGVLDITLEMWYIWWCWYMMTLMYDDTDVWQQIYYDTDIWHWSMMTPIYDDRSVMTLIYDDTDVWRHRSAMTLIYDIV